MAKLGNSQHNGGMFKTTNNVAGCNFCLCVYKRGFISKEERLESALQQMFRRFAQLFAWFDHMKRCQRDLSSYCSVLVCDEEPLVAACVNGFIFKQHCSTHSQTISPETVMIGRGFNYYHIHTSVSTSKDNSHKSALSPTA